MNDWDKLITDLTNLATNIEDSCLEESMKLGQSILDYSKDIVPVDTGALQDSTFLEKRGNIVTLGYGGSNAKINPKTGESTDKYMVEVHENLNMPHPNGGEAKFLEKPFFELTSNLGNKFAKEVVNNAIRK